MKLLLSPYSQKLRNGKWNPKTPSVEYWQKVIKGLEKDFDIIQIGLPGEEQLVHTFVQGAPLPDILTIVKDCTVWLSVDSFLQHLADDIKKPGVVLWSLSDPLIFGYPYNLNLLKSREYLRPNQFDIWENAVYNRDAFVDEDKVVAEVLRFARQR